MPKPGYEGEIGSHDWGGFVSAQAPSPASGLLSQEASIRAAKDNDLSARILGRRTIAVGSDYTVTSLDFEILVDATSGPVTISLLPATGSGQLLHVKKIDSTSSVVTVAASGTDLIDDSMSVALPDQWADCLLIDAAFGF